MQTIKAHHARARGARTNTAHGTWYEPLTRQEDIDLAVRFVLGRPGVFLNTVGDLTLLPKVFDAASRFTARTPDADMRDLVAKRDMAPLFV